MPFTQGCLLSVASRPLVENHYHLAVRVRFTSLAIPLSAARWGVGNPSEEGKVPPTSSRQQSPARIGPFREGEKSKAPANLHLPPQSA